MSREFSGSTTYGEVTSAPVTGPPFTVALWIKPDVIFGNDIVWILEQDGSNDYWRFKIGSDHFEFTARDGGSATATTTGTYDSTWQHMCAVEAAANDRRVYRNGGQKGTNTQSKTPDNVDTMSVGNRSDSSEDYDGNMGHLAIWDVALSDQEVLSLANGLSPLAMRPDNLV